MPYELPVMKNLLSRNLKGFINTLKNNVTKQDAYLRATRIKQLLESFSSIEDFSCIPSDSLIREFIGGSRYKY
ncbi:MAG: response regulator SirA, partial [Candidatus Aureabacteria bacterium]|nr:response regulator SirA [Candidatus Auribacterota bacterium]